MNDTPASCWTVMFSSPCFLCNIAALTNLALVSSFTYLSMVSVFAACLTSSCVASFSYPTATFSFLGHKSFFLGSSEKHSSKNRFPPKLNGRNDCDELSARLIRSDDEGEIIQNGIASIQDDLILDTMSSAVFTSNNQIKNSSLAPSNLENNMPNFYFIEQVNSKRRALDVKVFRQFSISAAEYLILANSKRNNNNNNNKDNNHDNGHIKNVDPCNFLTDGETISICESMVDIITEEEAIDLLMPGYDEFGNYILQSAAIAATNADASNAAIGSSTDREVYFVAVLNDEDAIEKEFNNQNGVVGVVSAKLRRFPSPHVYLANMRVHPFVQRRGIGSALLSSVCQYAESLNIHSYKQFGEDDGSEGSLKCRKVLLTVDNNNLHAIQMYEKFGFRHLDRNEEFGVMEFPLQ